MFLPSLLPLYVNMFFSMDEWCTNQHGLVSVPICAETYFVVLGGSSDLKVTKKLDYFRPLLLHTMPFPPRHFDTLIPGY